MLPVLHGLLGHAGSMPATWATAWRRPERDRRRRRHGLPLRIVPAAGWPARPAARRPLQTRRSRERSDHAGPLTLAVDCNERACKPARSRCWVTSPPTATAIRSTPRMRTIGGPGIATEPGRPAPRRPLPPRPRRAPSAHRRWRPARRHLTTRRRCTARWTCGSGWSGGAEQRRPDPLHVRPG